MGVSRGWFGGLRQEFDFDAIQIDAACIRNLPLACRCNDLCDTSKRSDVGFDDCKSVSRIDDHSHFNFASCDRRWDGWLLKPGKLGLQSINSFAAHFSESWHFRTPYEMGLVDTTLLCQRFPNYMHPRNKKPHPQSDSNHVRPLRAAERG